MTIPAGRQNVGRDRAKCSVQFLLALPRKAFTLEKPKGLFQSCLRLGVSVGCPVMFLYPLQSCSLCRWGTLLYLGSLSTVKNGNSLCRESYRTLLKEILAVGSPGTSQGGALAEGRHFTAWLEAVLGQRAEKIKEIWDVTEPCGFLCNFAGLNEKMKSQTKELVGDAYAALTSLWKTWFW